MTYLFKIGDGVKSRSGYSLQGMTLTIVSQHFDNINMKNFYGFRESKTRMYEFALELVEKQKRTSGFGKWIKEHGI